MNELPEGYTRLDSIPLLRVPEIEWYILSGFASFEAVKEKIEDLIKKSGVCTYKIISQQDSFAILLPHIVIPYLTESEQSQLIINHRIKSEVNQPTVWRFMGKEFVERFFKTGELRISTYANFANLDDLVRRDTDEGKITLQSKEGSLTSVMSIGVGFNALVLCTSLSQNNCLSNGKFYDACIEINDIQSFIREVTLKLVEITSVKSVIHGACVYHNKEFYKETQENYLSEIINQSPEGNRFDFTLFTRLAEETGGSKIFFSKPLEKQEECEYRMVWLTGCDQKEAITINVPEATKFCRPIYFE